MVIGAGEATANSLDELETERLDREPYAQFVDLPAPDFVLKDAAGTAISLTDMRGKVVVLWFIYSSCPDECLLHSEAIARVQGMVHQTPMRDLVRFVAVTTDPASDSSEALASYEDEHGFGPSNFAFLTSGAEDPDATRTIAESYGLKFTATNDGLQMHCVVTHLIDKSGQMRARFHGFRFKGIDMLVYINALTNDSH